MMHSVVVVDLVFKYKIVAAFDDFVNRVLRRYPLTKNYLVLDAELCDLDFVEYCVVVVHLSCSFVVVYKGNYIKLLIFC